MGMKTGTRFQVQRVELLYFEGCPNWRAAAADLSALQEEMGFELALSEVDSLETAIARDFRGSPTVLVNGTDPFADPAGEVGLSCRVYDTPAGRAGSPTRTQLRAAVVSAGRS